jgi:hypothetical protein
MDRRLANNFGCELACRGAGRIRVENRAPITRDIEDQQAKHAGLGQGFSQGALQGGVFRAARAAALETDQIGSGHAERQRCNARILR